MFSPDDTIIAIATPPGRGAIGVVRLSGPRATEIAAALVEGDAPLEPRRATLRRLALGSGTRRSTIDRVVVTLFPTPHSYTGQDVVEMSAHGSPVLLSEIVRAGIEAGARPAGRGEFTLRAFLNGRLDLAQAEAVADLVNATTTLQAKSAFDQLDGTLTTRIEEIEADIFDLVARLEASLDFPEEGYRFVDRQDAARAIDGVMDRVRALSLEARRGRIIREGVKVAIVGRPNVGKSSVFNRLAGADRAIVTEHPGTTRDLITEPVDVDGLAMTLVDTAGLRAAGDAIEVEGVRRAEQSVERAEIRLVVLDGSEPLQHDDRLLLERTAVMTRVVIANKSDRPRAWNAQDLPVRESILPVSAVSGEGLQELRDALVRAATGGEPGEPAAITNVRHARLVGRAQEALGRAARAAAAGEPEELVAADLHRARDALEEITGRRSTDDLLLHIFSTFCIGK